MSSTQGTAALPLSALRAFDAAARHLNMARAAAELGVTQGAVSRQIGALEDRLRETLFLRGPRGLKLTEAGDLLADYVRRGLEQLETGMLRIDQPRSRATLVVNAARTFAMRVLAPRIGDFVRAHPWIELRVATHRYFAQLHGSDVDVAIRTGTKQGFDLDLLRAVRATVRLPIVASGGVGNAAHFVDGARAGATGLLAASVFHYGEMRIADAKAALAAAGLPIRPVSEAP
jgi:DNA-binding transcriptional LysR family regulator